MRTEPCATAPDAKRDRDAFGHMKLDKVNVGEWLSRRLGSLVLITNEAGEHYFLGKN